MILICDTEVSSRAQALRRRFFSMGMPCAVCTVPMIPQLLPVRCIVAYPDAFHALRHGPYDHIFAVVIGKCFVNSALNAVRVENGLAACRAVRDYLLALYGIGKEAAYPGGMLVDPGIFLAEDFCEIYGNRILPTPTEYRIFKDLLAFSKTKEYLSPERLHATCATGVIQPEPEVAQNRIAVHIAHLNRKLEVAYGKHIIRPARFKGYYSLGSD